MRLAYSINTLDITLGYEKSPTDMVTKNRLLYRHNIYTNCLKRFMNEDGHGQRIQRCDFHIDVSKRRERRHYR